MEIKNKIKKGFGGNKSLDLTHSQSYFQKPLALSANARILLGQKKRF